MKAKSGFFTAFNVGVLLILLCFAAAIYNFPKLPRVGEFEMSDSAIVALDLRKATPSQLEILALNDGAPLFFYTEFNYGNIEFDLPTLSPIDVSEQDSSTYSALSRFEEGILKSVDFSTPKLMSPESSIYSIFGRGTSASGGGVKNFSKSEKQQKISLRILEFESGKLVYSGKLDSAIDTGDFLWSPVEMTMFVNLDGSASAPLATSLSGVEALDRSLEDFVLKNSDSFRLKPGFYKLVFSH